MTTVNWAQLTPDEQALLDKLARALLAGDEWVDMGNHEVFIGDEPEVSLNECDLIRTRYSDYKINITPAGLLVWQQGQVASAPAPRSVWVAMWHEYGEGDYLLSIHAQHETAQAACEVHTEQALKWEYTAGFDGMGEYRARVYDDDVLRGEYFVHEMPILP